MPYRKTNRICAYPGCCELTQERYCQQHKKDQVRKYDKQRGSSASRGYGYKWRQASKGYLSKEKHALCVLCLKEGSVVKATEVDHIIPHRNDMKLFWDKNNWQGLCKKHHSIKTAKEDGGYRNS